MLAKLRIATNAGAGPTSDRPRSVTVHLSGKRGTLVGVVNAIRASKIDIERIGARYVTVEVLAGRYTRPLHASLVIAGAHNGGLASIPLALTSADLAVTSLTAKQAEGRFSISVTA